ncbi:DUF551 domain-containing protein [Atlantibacter hermannii]|uniref:DUF551 domain-containing protein n=1 Tax=Atlantibacter hermannii TaxID=565 RepID=UPI00289C7FBA|nr:DUF551 domain-containing protein [Atlantibacter hermannii]
MTINERVSDERIANLIEVLSFYSPEDKHLANNESELASALRELQQYRAAAEPVCPKCGGTGMADSGGFYPWGEPIFIECDCHAAPQLPQPAVVPDAIEIDDDFDSAFEHGKAVGWNAYRAAMLQGAEPVSQPYTLPANVIDALGKALQAMSFMGDTLNALDAVCEEDVEYVTPAFEAVREVLEFAEPAQGWIPCGERMPEFYFSVLVTDEHEDMVIALPVYLDAGDRCAFQLSNGDIFIATHWMPLPAAPKQEAE